MLRKLWAAALILTFVLEVHSVGNGELTVIRARRGQQVVYKQYCFTHLRAKQNKNIRVWECVVRSCRCLLTTTFDINAVVRCNQHNHPANETLCSAKIFRATLKESIMHNPNQQTMKLCRAELLKADPGIVKHLVSKENIARSLMYHQSKKRPRLPRTAVELEIPIFLGKTKCGVRFILKSCVTDDDAILIQ